MLLLQLIYLQLWHELKELNRFMCMLNMHLNVNKSGFANVHHVLISWEDQIVKNI